MAINGGCIIASILFSETARFLVRAARTETDKMDQYGMADTKSCRENVAIPSMAMGFHITMRRTICSYIFIIFIIVQTILAFGKFILWGKILISKWAIVIAPLRMACAFSGQRMAAGILTNGC